MLDRLTDETRNTGIEYFKQMSNKSYIKFAVAIILLVTIYLIYVEITLYNLNKYIWRIKYLLGVIPLNIMIDKVEDIRVLIKELS